MERVFRHDRARLRMQVRHTDDLQPMVEMPLGDVFGEANLTRTGVFEYVLEDGSVRRELRHPDHVFDPVSMASARMMPIAHGHPEEDVAPGNFKELTRGWVGDSVEQDGDKLKAPVRLFDKTLIEDVVVNGKVEVSCGYWCELIEESGEYEGEAYDAVQTNIIYNHLAAGIDAGRAGPEVKIRVDGLSTEEEPDMTVIRMDSKEGQRRLAKVRTDAAAFSKFGIPMPRCDMEVGEEVADMLNGALDAALDALSAMKDEIGKLKGENEQMAEDAEGKEKELEEEKGKVDELQKQLTKANDSKTLDKRVAERTAVVTIASNLLSKKADELTGSNDEIRTAVLVHAHPEDEASLKGESEAYRKARFDQLVKLIDSNPLPPQSFTSDPSPAPGITQRGDATALIAEPFLEELEIPHDRGVGRVDAGTAAEIKHMKDSGRASRPLAFSNRR